MGAMKKSRAEKVGRELQGWGMCLWLSVKEGLSEVTFEQRLEGGECVSRMAIWREGIPGEVDTKASFHSVLNSIPITQF